MIIKFYYKTSCLLSRALSHLSTCLALSRSTRGSSARVGAYLYFLVSPPSPVAVAGPARARVAGGRRGASDGRGARPARDGPDARESGADRESETRGRPQGGGSSRVARVAGSP